MILSFVCREIKLEGNSEIQGGIFVADGVSNCKYAIKREVETDCMR
jgi:hypothetical protein